MPARRWGKFLLPLLALVACNDPAGDAPANPDPAGANAGLRDGVRFATFNASLNRNTAGQLIMDLSNFDVTNLGTTQAKNAAETIQRIRPDVVLINEFDFDAGGTAARLFQENYLARSINGSEPITYPYRYVAESNTGIPSGFDLNNNGVIAGGDDAFGFGLFPGQFGMAVYSMYPIVTGQVRTFQKFLWKDMPGAILPDDPATAAPADWYSPAELAVFRLSSKSHWDLPLQIGGKVVHFLVSHPTPPVFDGPEDRNGTRNFDEVRFWADYIHPARGGYIYDDTGRRGGLEPGALFVIAGDQNSDPLDGDSRPGAAQQLIEHPLINARSTPESQGAVQQATLQGGINTTHRSDPRFDTADFADGAPGNLRADYLLPRVSIQILRSAVFWPLNTDPLFRLVGVFNPSFLGGFPTSDHRLVWADLSLPGVRP
jgi:endonuclease/exonuclease/phosphatase family protein